METTRGPQAVMYGNPVDGFSFVGPFPDHETALLYVESDGSRDWWIVALDAPAEEFTDDNL